MSDSCCPVVIVEETRLVVVEECDELVVSVVEEIVKVEIDCIGIQGPKGEPGTSFSTTNKEGSTLPAGAVVATHSSGVGVIGGNATTDAKPAIGLLVASAANNAAATVQTGGPFELSDWTAVTGTVTLAAKASYFLNTTSGRLVATTPPGSFGNIVQAVGEAVSPTILNLEIGEPILL